jgi:hypothetical protein
MSTLIASPAASATNKSHLQLVLTCQGALVVPMASARCDVRYVCACACTCAWEQSADWMTAGCGSGVSWSRPHLDRLGIFAAITAFAPVCNSSNSRVGYLAVDVSLLEILGNLSVGLPAGAMNYPYLFAADGLALAHPRLVVSKSSSGVELNITTLEPLTTAMQRVLLDHTNVSPYVCSNVVSMSRLGSGVSDGILKKHNVTMRHHVARGTVNGAAMSVAVAVVTDGTQNVEYEASIADIDTTWNAPQVLYSPALERCLRINLPAINTSSSIFLAARAFVNPVQHMLWYHNRTYSTNETADVVACLSDASYLPVCNTMVRMLVAFMGTQRCVVAVLMAVNAQNVTDILLTFTAGLWFARYTSFSANLKRACSLLVVVLAVCVDCRRHRRHRRQRRRCRVICDGGSRINCEM